MSETTTRGPDILTQTAPALSATSDAPLAPVATPPLSASNSAADQANGTPPEMSGEEQAAARAARQGTAQPAAADQAPEPTPATPAAPERAAPPKRTDFADQMAYEEALTEWRIGDPAHPKWFQREITKSRNKERDAIARATAAEKRATDAEAAIEEARKAAPIEIKAPAEAPADPKPQRAAFDSPDAYDDALAQWAAREGARQATTEIQRQQQEAAAETKRKADEAEAERQRGIQEAEVTKLTAAWNERREAALEKYPDYQAVAENDDVQISQAMAAAIFQSDNGPDIAYHLGQNPDEAARIAGIQNPVIQAVEIGKLAARLSVPARPSRAPRPIQPLEGNNAAADASEREPTMDEWAARRTPQIQAGFRPFMPPTPTRH